MTAAGKNSLLRKLSLAVLCIALGYCVTCNLSVLLAPCQLEYREGAVLLQVNGILEGKPVYDVHGWSIYLNNYGILFNLISSWVAHLTGPGFFPSRLVSLVAIVGSVLLLDDCLRRRKVPGLFRLFLAIWFYAALIYPNTPFARPDALGEFFFVAALWVFELAPSSAAEIVAIPLLSVTAFLVKLYFLIASPLVFSYAFLFRSKRRSVLHAIVFVGALICAYALCQRILPGYLAMSTAITTGSVIRITGTTTKYMLRQSLHFFTFLLPVLLAWCAYRRSLWPSGPFSWRKLSFPAYGAFLMLALLEIRLGHNDGAWLTYYFQLLGPFLLLWMGQTVTREEPFENRATSGLLLAACLLLFAFPLRHLMSPLYIRQDARQEAQLASDIAGAKNVLTSSLLVHALIQQGKPVYESGQSQYIFQAGRPSAKILPGSPFATQQGYADVWNRHQAWVSDQLAHRSFDMVLHDASDAFTPEQVGILSAGYRLARKRQFDQFVEEEWVPR